MINGLGMGNSTRCHAVIERLAEPGCRVHILTSGNGLTYFRGKDCVESLTPMESFFYSGRNGGISGWSTLKSVRRLSVIARTKRTQLEQLLDRVRPDIAVIDSEYAVAPLRRRGIPVVGLNTSEMIVSEYLKCRKPARGTRSHFWFVEFSDYLFHRHFCNLVLSPYPLRSEARHRKFRRIGLIARSCILDQVKPGSAKPFPSPRQLRRIVFMLSGSVHASNIRFEGREFPFKIDVVGRPGQSLRNVTFHGRQMNNVELLTQADALVINGGYSAVSEAFVLRKPVFVVPVPGHAEQFVNANLVQELGLGFLATEQNVLEQLLSMHQQDRWVGLKPMPGAFEIDGAREAASAILSFPESIRTSSPAKSSMTRLLPGDISQISHAGASRKL
jgi:UDP:flavonoid glycosyltransferase YjiC (YdhE family)